MSRPVVAVYDTSLSRPRITLAANEVRVKFPPEADGVDKTQALEAARALEHRLRDATITLRGRIELAHDGGMRTTLRSTNGRQVGKYHIDAAFNVTEMP